MAIDTQERVKPGKVRDLISFFNSSPSQTTRDSRPASTPPEREVVRALLPQFEGHELPALGTAQAYTHVKCQLFSPIRSQRSYAVSHRLAPEMEIMLGQKRRQMGKLERKNKPDAGLGGGILISESHVLLPRHCIDLKHPQDFNIQFEFLDPSVRYHVKEILSAEEAAKLGLQAGELGDLVVVALEPDAYGDYPGKNENYTAIKKPEEENPAVLHFMGYSAGTALQESSMPGRPIALSDVVQRGKDVVGELAVWNDFKTHGDITSQDMDHLAATLSVMSPSREHKFTVKGKDVYRKNGSLANAVNECFVLYPHLCGTDHVRLAHRTKAGSSGGIYFTVTGEIFAVHCGRLLSNKAYPEHIAFYPWTKTTTTFYDPYLIYETKPRGLNKINNNDFLQITANCAFSYDNAVKGYLSAVVHDEESAGYRFTIQEQAGTFSFIVPYASNALIEIKGERYRRAELFFNFADCQAPKPQVQAPPPGLFTVSLADLKKGIATNEIPADSQKEIERRLTKDRRKIKHSMTVNGLRFEHTTIGAAQQQGSHYEFVENADKTITIHALGTHKTGTSYQISQQTAAFRDAAIESGLWMDADVAKKLMMPIFKLNR